MVTLKFPINCTEGKFQRFRVLISSTNHRRLISSLFLVEIPCLAECFQESLSSIFYFRMLELRHNISNASISILRSLFTTAKAHQDTIAFVYESKEFFPATRRSSCPNKFRVRNAAGRHRFQALPFMPKEQNTYLSVWLEVRFSFRP